MSDHFSIVFATKTNEISQRPVVKSTYKRSYCEKNIDKLKNILHNRNWDGIKKIEHPNKAYKYFLDIFIDIYDNSHPKSEVKVKSRAIRALGLLKVLRKSSKKKRRLYKRFLKNRTPKLKSHIKLIKTCLKLKRDQRKNFTHKNCGSLKVMREKHGVL